MIHTKQLLEIQMTPKHGRSNSGKEKHYYYWVIINIFIQILHKNAFTEKVLYSKYCFLSFAVLHCRKPIIHYFKSLISMCVCLCVKVEDEKSAGESKPKQEKEKQEEKKGDSEQGAGSAGKFSIYFTHRQSVYQNTYSRSKWPNLSPKQSTSSEHICFVLHCYMAVCMKAWPHSSPCFW